MKTYKVKSNLKHDGKEYKRGDTVELEEAVAANLIAGNVIVDSSDKANDPDLEDTPVNPQPPVNEVKREGAGSGDKAAGDVDAAQVVEPGKVETPQPGDNQDNNEVAKSQYKVVKGLEFPRGTVHEAGAVIELSDEEAGGFAEGLLEKVENGDNL